MRGLSCSLSLRIRVAFVALATTSGICLLSESVSNAHPQPPAIAEHSADITASQDALPASFPIDVTDLFEAKVSSLKPLGRNLYSSTVILRNITEESVPGPLLFAIEGTGITGLEPVDADGSVSLIPLARREQRKSSVNNAKESARKPQDFPYFELLQSGILKKAGETKNRRIVFRSKENLSPEQRKTFQLSWQVTRERPVDLSAMRSRKTLVPGKAYTQADLKRVMALQEKWTREWMKNKEVLGTGTSEDANGELAVVVLVKRAGAMKQLPRTLGGVKVLTKTISPIFAGPAGARGNPGNKLKPVPEKDLNAQSNVAPQSGPGGNPRQRFPRPVPIGTSSSNIASGCLSGTFGFRASRNNGDKFLVSNYHVWARNGNARPGELILQPSRGDSGCSRNNNNRIGTFAELQTIDFNGGLNEIDAAIVRMDEGGANACTPDDGYGFPKSQVAQAVVGARVQKYGRTTGQTSGEIFVINATIRVNYGNAGTATFRRQVGVRDVDGDFSRGGDSGSLIVTDPDARPVALLFAGGGTSTFGNPINAVLSRFQLTVDGEGDNGEEPDPENASIGNLVWQDVNCNGIKDAEELGLRGVLVELYDPGDNGTVDDDDQLLDRTLTDQEGLYEFDGLAAGNYYVRFVAPNGRSFTTQDAPNSTDENDSDANVRTGLTPVIDLGESERNDTIDAGLKTDADEDPRTGRIGNRVWFDFNRNGRQDWWEPGLRRRTVMLFSADTNSLLRVTRTNRRGFYSFRNLPAGRYIVQFVPGRLRFTRPNVGRDWRDSDANPATGRTEPFNLRAGQATHKWDAGLTR